MTKSIAFVFVALFVTLFTNNSQACQVGPCPSQFCFPQSFPNFNKGKPDVEDETPKFITCTLERINTAKTLVNSTSTTVEAEDGAYEYAKVAGAEYGDTSYTLEVSYSEESETVVSGIISYTKNNSGDQAGEFTCDDFDGKTKVEGKFCQQPVDIKGTNVFNLWCEATY